MVKSLTYFCRTLVFLPAFGMLVLASCKKHSNTEKTSAPETLQHGILVLNEGLFNLNNSSLSWIDLNNSAVDNSFFEEKTGRALGDTGNDMERYGNKIYIVVNVSSTVEILDAVNGHSLKQISMITGSTPQQPRSVAFWKNKALVSCFDGYVSVIDTATLTVTTRIAAGSNPEGLAVSGDRLFVANSGGLNPVQDSTVSVIDMNSLQEITKVTIGLNPGSVCTDNQGDVYVISRGNYGSVPSRMHKIEAQTLNVTDFGFDAGGMTMMNDNMLVSYYNMSTQTSNIGLFNTLNETLVTPTYLSVPNIQTLYGVYYFPATDQICLTDAKGYTETGNVLVYSSGGTLLNVFPVGLNPSKILIYE